MADGISITDLEQKAEVTDNDNFAVDNGAITNKVTAKQIKDYMGPTYVKKSGDTMTGPLKLPAPAADLNDNTAITAAWARKYGVNKAGDTMTGPLKLPAPAAGLNDNTAITAAWARALITGKTVVKDYITERFSDGNGNWYEVYASGWIRQGGTKTATSEGDVITFLKPFASTNYKFWSSCKTANNDNTARTFAEILSYPRTNTSIHIKSLPYFAQTQGDWFAEGQGPI